MKMSEGRQRAVNLALALRGGQTSLPYGKRRKLSLRGQSFRRGAGKLGTERSKVDGPFTGPALKLLVPLRLACQIVQEVFCSNRPLLRDLAQPIERDSFCHFAGVFLSKNAAQPRSCFS